jgi:hypothetical protein
MNENELASILAAAAKNPSKEPEAMRALLDATLYAHAPIGDDSGRLRFVQFHRPESGKLVLPIFSDEAKANAANPNGTVRIVSMKGYQLFELTLGATLMLDPNDRDCELYPEEIEALLLRGEAGCALRYSAEEHNQPLVIRRPIKTLARLASTLRSLYAKLEFIDSAYLCVARREGMPKRSEFLLIAVVAPPGFSGRALRATVAAMQPHLTEPGMAIDVVVSDTAELTAAFRSGGLRIYQRMRH